MNQKLWVLDFDRCLGDVEALYEHLEKVIDTEGLVSTSELRNTRQKVEQSGGSFNALALCRERLTAEQYQQLLDTYGAESFLLGHFLLEGAKRFLSWLQETRQPYMVMTYGEKDWQLAKLKRAGLGEVAYMIMANPHKTKVIGAWRRDAEMELPLTEIAHGQALPQRVKEAVLVDDKAKAFAGSMPAGLRGYWLQRGPLVSSQMGEVSDGVVTVHSFDEIIEAESHTA